MDCIGEYAEGNILTVYMLRRGMTDPTDYDTLQVTFCGTLIESGYGQFCLGVCTCESDYERSQAEQEVALWS